VVGSWLLPGADVGTVWVAVAVVLHGLPQVGAKFQGVCHLPVPTPPAAGALPQQPAHPARLLALPAAGEWECGQAVMAWLVWMESAAMTKFSLLANVDCLPPCTIAICS